MIKSNVMKFSRLLFLSFILGVYTLTFIATKKNIPCNDDCERVTNFRVAMMNGRDSYILTVFRCTYNVVSDSICFTVRDSAGINWNALADTACTLAAQNGLLHQKLFFFRTGTGIPDTLLKRQCP